MYKYFSYRVVWVLLFGIVFVVVAIVPTVYSATMTKFSPPPVDKRVFFDIRKAGGEFPETEKTFNFDPPNIRVAYNSRVLGLQFSIPYNTRWGSENYKIRAYDEYITERVKTRTLAFGPIIGDEGGGRREFILQFKPRVSTKVLLKQLPAKYGECDLVGTPKVRRINGLETISYTCLEMHDFSYIIVIGKKYNYHFSGEESAQFVEMEKIIKTMRLIK